MESNRIFGVRNKPRVVLDKRFSFTDKLQVGDKGQLRVDLDVESIKLRADEDGNDMRITTLLIKEAEIIDFKETRLT